MKSIIRLVVLFLFTFAIFISSSYAMYHLNQQIQTSSINLGVDDDTLPILNNMIEAFQIIFGILAIGTGLAIIIAIITGKRGDTYEIYG